MAKNFFKSYIWLIETLQSRGSLTLKEIQNLWLHSSVNDEKKKLAPRTFYNRIQSIADIFGIEIVCDPHDHKYYIDNEDEIGGGELRNWMLESLSLNSLLNESVGIKDRITIIRAIRSANVLNVRYQSYRKPAPEDLVLEPWCLREFKRRWYLFAHKEGDEVPHMFALDRVLNMEIGSEKFSVPKTFSAHNYFEGYYGVRVYDDLKREIVIVKASNMQAKYFKSLPLHKSQEIVEEGPEFTTFKYFLTPDYDFKQDVLSFGAEVEVLEPEHVRKELAETIGKLNKRYNGTAI